MTATAAVRERPILFSSEMVRALLAGTKTQTRRVVTSDNSKFGAWGKPFWALADFSKAWVDGVGSGSEYLHVPVKAETAGLMEGVVDRLYPRIAPARCWDQESDEEDGYEPPASQLWVRESWNIGRPAITYGPNAGAGFIPKLHFRPSPMTVDQYREAYRDYKLAYAASWGSNDVPPWRPSIHMPRWASRITLEITNVRVERVQSISRDDAMAEGIDEYGHDLATEAARDERRNRSAIENFRALWDSLNASRGYSWELNPWVWVITFKRIASEAGTVAA